jgi:ribosome-binding factor A
VQTIKQVQMMKKIIAGREKGKRRFVYNENLPKSTPNPQKISNPTGEYGKAANRRIIVLNKLFMKNVTDLMSTGEFAEKLFGKGIQISTLKVAQDFKKMNIYWTADNNNDMSIDKLLKSLAGPLRHELSVLRIIGDVPQINFVRDRAHMKTSEIDSLLQTADFGEDFEPTDTTLFMRSESKLEMKIPDHLRDEIKKLDEIFDIEDELEESIPAMRHDTFGLDHAKIMNKILADLNKSVKAWEKFEKQDISDVNKLEEIPIKTKSPFDEIAELNNQAENRTNFIKYLEQKHAARRITPERKKHRNFLNEEESEDSFEYVDPIPDNDYLDDKKL